MPVRELFSFPIRRFRKAIFISLIVLFLLVSPSVLQIARAQSVATIIGGLGSEPYRLAVDSSTGNIYVSNNGGSSLSVISGASNKVQTSVSGASYPNGVAFDSSNGDIYATQPTENSVAVISGTSNNVITTIPVGSGPRGIAFDSSNGGMCTWLI